MLGGISVMRFFYLQLAAEVAALHMTTTVHCRLAGCWTSNPQRLLGRSVVSSRTARQASTVLGGDDQCTCTQCTLRLVRLSAQVSVRALSCSGSGTTTWLLSAINYVTEACKLTDSKKCVVNMSLGYRVVVSQVDTAIKNSINSGVVYVVAAGNSQTDSCRSTPGSVREAINIAATDSADTKPSWSNFGQCKCSPIIA